MDWSIKKMNKKICDGLYCNHELYKAGHADYAGKWVYKEIEGKKYCVTCINLEWY